jgi:hypothetical protein
MFALTIVALASAMGALAAPTTTNNVTATAAANKPVATAASANPTQTCMAWATANGGPAVACGMNARFEADDDDICDKAGKFCAAFCCDYRDEAAADAALLSAFNTMATLQL